MVPGEDISSLTLRRIRSLSFARSAGGTALSLSAELWLSSLPNSSRMEISVIARAVCVRVGLTLCSESSTASLKSTAPQVNVSPGRSSRLPPSGSRTLRTDVPFLLWRSTSVTLPLTMSSLACFRDRLLWRKETGLSVSRPMSVLPSRRGKTFSSGSPGFMMSCSACTENLL